ncbi:MAG: ATP-dependent Clp protease adaptor ClpS [Bacteroidales bacterium]|nr:ATP-dependent Clp protease adaptor ClpS [Bacteroidales bacterium]
MVKEEIQKNSQNEEELSGKRELILHNDEYNTFDFVIECLMEVCGHELEQAEQCAFIAHYKGFCPVKSGSLSELKRMKAQMTNRKLIVEIK